MAGNKLKSNKSNKISKKLYKVRNSENSITIKENKTFNKEQIPIYFDQIDLSSIPKFCGNSSLKSKPLNKDMFSKNNNEIVLCDKDKKRLFIIKK